MAKNKQEDVVNDQEEVKPNSKKYVCNYQVRHDGKLYKEHDFIDIESHHAEKLLAIQAISEV